MINFEFISLIWLLFQIIVKYYFWILSFKSQWTTLLIQIWTSGCLKKLLTQIAYTKQAYSGFIIFYIETNFEQQKKSTVYTDK